MMFTAYNCK